MLGFSPQEFLVFTLIIVLLGATGLLQPVLNALRELRGGRPADAPPSPTDLDISFRLLGLAPSATLEEVERAYRQKAKKHHPDLGGDDDAMRALNEAYNLIKNARRLR
ncbi:MAG: DnaJ domain-containing protein [Candidatus Hydrogenedentes bacterium]|nr:DnaJ domain-containing protein [Candidatus Hydrogenedentota bacterium]MBI3118096.1 DnaJ domain-containing protein [Candidatus Hydrogenedentota bacterium]